MMWVFAIMIVLAMGAIAMLAAGRGAPLAPAYDDRPDAAVPADRPLEGEDLRRVRFSLALRGYRMSEVDALLSRLAHEMEAARRTDEPGDHAREPEQTPDTEADSRADTDAEAAVEPHAVTDDLDG